MWRLRRGIVQGPDSYPSFPGPLFMSRTSFPICLRVSLQSAPLFFMSYLMRSPPSSILPSQLWIVPYDTPMSPAISCMVMPFFRSMQAISLFSAFGSFSFLCMSCKRFRLTFGRNVFAMPVIKLAHIKIIRILANFIKYHY